MLKGIKVVKKSCIEQHVESSSSSCLNEREKTKETDEKHYECSSSSSSSSSSSGNWLDLIIDSATERKKTSKNANANENKIHKLELNPYMKSGHGGLPPSPDLSPSSSSFSSSSCSVRTEIDKSSLLVGDGGRKWRQRAAMRAAERRKEQEGQDIKKSNFGFTDKFVHVKNDDYDNQVKDNKKNFNFNRNKWGGRSNYEYKNKNFDERRSTFFSNSYAKEKENATNGEDEQNDDTYYQKEKEKKDGFSCKQKWKKDGGEGEEERYTSSFCQRSSFEEKNKNGWKVKSDKINVQNEEEKCKKNKNLNDVFSSLNSKYDKMSLYVEKKEEEKEKEKKVEKKAEEKQEEKKEEKKEEMDEEKMLQLDVNELSSLSLKYMMKGNKYMHEKINNIIKRKQDDSVNNNNNNNKYNQNDNSKNFSKKIYEKNTIRNNILQERRIEELSERRRHIMDLHMRDDEGASVDEMVRREKLMENSNYDKHYAHFIRKRGKNFAEDSDEDGKVFDVKDALENRKKKMKQNAKPAPLNQAKKKPCIYCIDSEMDYSEVRENVISLSADAYVAVQKWKDCVLPYHLIIAPIVHSASMTSVEEDVYTEIRNYQKSIVMYFDSMDMAPVFVETVTHFIENKDMYFLGGGKHTFIECLPIPYELLDTARAYFKKAFDECESEWNVHRKIIDVPKTKQIRGAIPKHIPYIHADFSLNGGIAHVIEDGREFSRKLGREIVLGMLHKDVCNQPFKNKKEHAVFREKVKSGFEKFDWSRIK